MTDRKALGRGLAALIPQRLAEKEELIKEMSAQSEDTGRWIYKGKEVLYISVDSIKPNRFQPRKDFNDSKLKELTESVRQKGVLQPVLARQIDNDSFELLAGERRWRAAKAVGLDKIPVIIKETTDSDALEISLIENLQRDDLNPLEEARAYKRMMDEFGLTFDKVSEVVGRAPSSISNILRLLTLPQKVQEAILAGIISTGHAKAILALKDPREQERLTQRIIKNGLSVREAERLSGGAKASKTTKEVLKKDVQIVAFEEDLQKRLGTKVKIAPGKRGGSIIIEYFSNTDFERILDLIKGGTR